MAQLILTAEEARLPLMKYDDATLGQLVKMGCLKMRATAKEKELLVIQMGAYHIAYESINLQWVSSTHLVTVENPDTNEKEKWTIICRKNSWWKDLIRNFFLTLFPFLK